MKVKDEHGETLYFAESVGFMSKEQHKAWKVAKKAAKMKAARKAAKREQEYIEAKNYAIDQSRKSAITGYLFRFDLNGKSVAGRVLKRLSNDTFEVFLYRYLGQTNDTVTVNIKDMRTWAFIWDSPPKTYISPCELDIMLRDKDRVRKANENKL